ncbi:GH3 auxin-responsive promoter-domain-containing protein [Boletus reticuloceps]|uniref:GH3 auxin-responsive promoter-domain-containing protein n=1 Tax=Boletus reticuloceps TaxID=495285 RepID=A0A8I2Z1X0_9AGAM|nr:GH3 auxin-responsive promoter-domain-containing protein [Boletus reticuloceps]
MPQPSLIIAVLDRNKFSHQRRTAARGSPTSIVELHLIAVMDTVRQGVSATRTPEVLAALREHTNRALLGIMRDNLGTKYASQAALLAGFRTAVSAHGGTDIDANTMLADFRSHVPLSTYDAYKPFVDKFEARPCKEEDVVDLFSPGLPDFFAVSSATSGTTPKILPKYNHYARLGRPLHGIFDPNGTPPLAGLICTSYRDVKEIESAPGQVVQRIPVCAATGIMLRRPLGWYIDDETQMTHPCTCIPFLPSMTCTHVLSILGPDVALRAVGYQASEGTIGFAHDASKLDEFVLKTDDIVEFLDVSRDETHEQLCQAWEVEVGKHYEPIFTTRDGLWRYQLGDIISIIGFDAKSGAPVFTHSGRRSFTIHLAHTQITGEELLAATQALDADPEDVLHVQEFTTVIDDRAVPTTVGFFAELAEPLGPNAHLAPQRLFDALVATNVELKRLQAHGKMRLPTIRIVEAGTFAAYRRLKTERARVPSGQIKVPLVLLQPEMQAWILERVVWAL